MPATYEPIATTTLGSAASSITFSSIPATYTDLRLVLFVKTSAGDDLQLRFNTSTTTAYSYIYLYGNGTATASGSQTTVTYINPSQPNQLPTTQFSLITADIFSYAGSTNKTVLCTNSNDLSGSGVVERTVGLWRDTSAINQIVLSPSSGQFTIGTSATIYGILKA
jgi:hypothetical protein